MLKGIDRKLNFKVQVFYFVNVHMQNIKVACGEMRSPIFEMYRELEFLQVCVPQ